MRNRCLLFLLSIGLGFTAYPLVAQTAQVEVIHQSANQSLTERSTNQDGGEYTLVIEGFDWGPAVSKVILTLDEEVTAVQANNYAVSASRSTDLVELAPEQATGRRRVRSAYVSDAQGNHLPSGKHVTLILSVGPELPMDSPIQYIRKDGSGRNQWIDYQLTISDTSNQQVWDTEAKRIMPLIDQFDLAGKYTHDEELTFLYADYTPETDNEKSPLIIWLHGGGEGGTDPTIPLVANRAANYAAADMQVFFGGAYVLVPQCPTAWMHNKTGVMTRGKDDDIYHEGLMALIRDYVAAHPAIDTNRIYLGGCSNGGYMTLKLILEHPDYFAAGFPSALAYRSQYITDEQIERIKRVPMWFIHSADDTTTRPDLTAVPVYQRLKAAGAENVHFSYFDHVVDLTRVFGGKNYHYSGHWSWIYSHTNACRRDFDGTPVMHNGRPVTLMEWMARRSK